ncbi:hypothetical protein DNTS_017217 [Danionella cerebrum]|uniref:Uncharacterized protein n=1 Tax=Danionella cerebrum TaxID=2873325 RepID=A0A553QBP1_9TELE|nr:hypothetical protein DNTS_017217 [Danionella translucida]
MKSIIRLKEKLLSPENPPSPPQPPFAGCAPLTWDRKLSNPPYLFRSGICGNAPFRARDTSSSIHLLRVSLDYKESAEPGGASGGVGQRNWNT